MHNNGAVRNTLAIVVLSLVVGLSSCNRAHKPIGPAADLTPDEYNVFSGYLADTFSRRDDKDGDGKQATKLIVLNTTQSGDDDLLPDENGHPVPWEKTAESLRKKAPRS